MQREKKVDIQRVIRSDNQDYFWPWHYLEPGKPIYLKIINHAYTVKWQKQFITQNKVMPIL